MNKKNDISIEKKIEGLSSKVEKLQNSIDNLDQKLSNHIKFIDKVYEPLRNPISKIKNFFN
tara:strand:- start:1110 stop:1292 length:183 start_codon:yes stop_codon:yes gene_type:complete